MANSADPDQKPADLNLYCLQRQDISTEWDARYFTFHRVCQFEALVMYPFIYTFCGLRLYFYYTVR